MMPGDPVVGSTVLRRPAIQSPNYVAGSAGWTVNSDGSAEFNNVTVRGEFQAGTAGAAEVQIDQFGELLFFDSGGNLVIVINPAKQAIFIYNPGGGAGNLVNSIANAAGTDAYGNNYLAGTASYQANFASQLGAGFVVFYHGSLAGGWTQGGQVETTNTGGLVLDTGSGSCTITGALSVNGSGSTANGSLTDGTINGTSGQSGLPNGTITGTSGAASAGTAHTHGGGSYSVTNGQHTHGAGSYAVTNGTHNHVL